MLKALCIWFKLCSSLTGQAHAIDGDTLVVEGTHIRLAGIDAPELSEKYGNESRILLQFLINNGVTCRLNGDKSYNRYVGTCMDADNDDLGATMVQFGLALDCARYSGGKYHSLEPAYARSKLTNKPYC